tara:strand:- start:448 stop:639 length:192 start_codon:yes stop_codon:yes gene_type:complete
MAKASVKESPITLTLTPEEAKALLLLINEYFESIEWDGDKMSDELVEISGALEALPLRLGKTS